MNVLKKWEIIISCITALPFVILAVVLIIELMVSVNKHESDIYIFDYKPIITVSESMEPEIMTNSLGLSKKVNFEDIEVGDVIIYESADYSNVIHRVIKKYKDRLITKGDNNDYQDPLEVYPEQIKAVIVKNFNDTAKPITLLVGDLTKPNYVRLTIVLVLTTAIIVQALVALNWLQTSLSLAIYRSRRQEELWYELSDWIAERVTSEEMEVLFSNDSLPTGLFKRIIYNIRLTNLVNKLDTERKAVLQTIKQYNKICQIKKD